MSFTKHIENDAFFGYDNTPKQTKYLRTYLVNLVPYRNARMWHMLKEAKRRPDSPTPSRRRGWGGMHRTQLAKTRSKTAQLSPQISRFSISLSALTV